ncbi:MAG TPA: hypothetical protein VL359_18615 [bacterium]|nr:hypothetical protein [bacterium]
MAQARKSGFTTLYESEDSGLLVFDVTGELDEEIQSCLAALHQLQEDFRSEATIREGLKELEVKLQNLRFSKEPAEEIKKKLEALVQVPIGDKMLRLDAFRRSSAKKAVGNEQSYVERVKRLVRNTRVNATLLLVSWPDDAQLQALLKQMDELDLSADYAGVRKAVEALGRSKELQHYNERKKSFLVEWLKPYQGRFNEPIQFMTPDRFMEALRQVESIRGAELKELANLSLEPNREPFKMYNRGMQPIMNGKFKDFWGSLQVRDEFITLMTRLVQRYSFNLEDRFLLFRTADDGFVYMVGFADEVFDHPVLLEGGKLGLYPHLKVFLHRGNEYQEITPGNYKVNKQAYFRALKTAVVPFFVAIAKILELPLSKELHDAFDMWI